MSDGPFGRRSEPIGSGVPPMAPGDEPEADASGRARPSPAPPAPPRGISSVTWILGVAVVLALAYITLNTIRTDAPGSRGIAVGRPLPLFAAPVATGGVIGDAQVDPEKVCGLRGDAIVNSCTLRERGPSVVAFLATRSKQCEQQIDVLDRVAARHPRVGAAVVSIRGDRDALRTVVSKRGWKLPVAYDRDGAVANLFAVAVCPTMTFARKGGAVASTTLGLVGEAELERRMAEIDG